jgi:uncharacterized protein YbcI
MSGYDVGLTERALASTAAPSGCAAPSVFERPRRCPSVCADGPNPYGEGLAAITTALVSLHKEFYGKGPVKAKSFLVNDTVICILEGGFTIVERTLIDAGDATAVHDIRRRFQAVMKAQFSGVVEGALGRAVRAYMSQVHTDPDIAVELFVLEPTGEPVVAEHHLEVQD